MPAEARTRRHVLSRRSFARASLRSGPSSASASPARDFSSRPGTRSTSSGMARIATRKRTSFLTIGPIRRISSRPIEIVPRSPNSCRPPIRSCAARIRRTLLVTLKNRPRSTRTVPRTNAIPNRSASPTTPPRNERIASLVRFTAARKRTVSTPSRRIRTNVSPNRPAATAPRLFDAIASILVSMARLRPFAVLSIQRTIDATKTAPRSISHPS